MIEPLQIRPSGLQLVGARLRCCGREMAEAARGVGSALDDMDAYGSAPLTAAALELALAARAAVSVLAVSAESLATAFEAAADRYTSADALVASLGRLP